MAHGLSGHRLVVTAAALLAVGLVLLQTSLYGARVTADSVEYVTAAQSFAAGGPLVRYNGEPLVYWPPLFPVVLSGRASSLAEAASTARWLNALCMGAIVALAGTWLHGLLSRRWLAGVGTVLVACAFPLHHVAGSVWSEPLFILLGLLCLWAVQVARRPGGGWGPVVGAGVCAGLAGLTRYAGVLVVVAGAMALVVPLRAVTRRRVGQAVVFVALGTGPLAWWLVGTSRSTGEPIAGDRPESTAGLLGLVRTVADGLAAWFVPPPAPVALRVGLVGAAVVFVVWVARRARRASGERLSARLRAVVPLALFLPVYVAGIVAATYITYLTPPEGRLLAPLVVPALVVGFVVLDAALSAPDRLAARALSGGVVGLVVCQAALAVVLVAPGIQRRVSVFEGPDWTKSQLMAQVDAQAFGSEAYTNAPWAVYYQTGRRLQPLTRPDRDAGDVLDVVAGGGEATAVWFDNPSVASLASLREEFHVDPVLVVGDGGVYRISAKPAD